MANTKLINIDLSYNNIKSIEKLYLQNKINLTNIDLSNNKISGTIDFGINEGLESINVYGNEDLKISMYQVIKSCQILILEKQSW